MKKIPDYIISIQLDCVGDITKTRYIGSFRVKAVLTHEDRFMAERFYAELMPSHSGGLTEELKTRATVMAELKARVVSGPEWWSGSKDGMLLIDSSPLYELMGKCSEAYMEWSKKLEDEANKDLNANTGLT